MYTILQFITLIFNYAFFIENYTFVSKLFKKEQFKLNKTFDDISGKNFKVCYIKPCWYSIFLIDLIILNINLVYSPKKYSGSLLEGA